MLPRNSLEAVFIVLIVHIVLGEAVGDPPGLALLLVVVVRFRRVVIAGGIPVLRHGAHVREEGLRGAAVLVGQVSQTAGQVRRRRHAVALSAGHFVRGPLHRRAEETLVAGHHGLPGGGHRIGRGSHVGQRDLGPSRNGRSMTDERGHEICSRVQK